MRINSGSNKRIFDLFKNNFLVRVFFYFVLLCLVWSVRFPFIFRKIYAEDGKLFLSDALRFNFPLDLLHPAAGYSQLMQRLGGRFVSMFPLDQAPLICGLFSALCLSFFAAGVFQYNNFVTQEIWPRFILSLSLIFLPLTSYSAVGNVANLYVFPTIASAILLYHNESTKKAIWYKSSVYLLATLSLPLSAFLLPIMLHRSYLDKKVTGRWKIQHSDLVLLIGLFTQFIFIMVTSLGERLPHSPSSPLKTIYLYLDRGIGISTIPKWGFVSGSSGNVKYDGTVFFLQSPAIRMVAVLAVSALIASIYIKGRNALSHRIQSQIFFIIFLGFTYSILVGLFFNPEPRYMIFASFLTCWALLLLFESQPNRRLRSALNIYLVIVLMLGLTASAHRSQGPNWDTEFEKAKISCQSDSNLTEVRIRTIPVDAFWEMTIPCEKLKNRG